MRIASGHLEIAKLLLDRCPSMDVCGDDQYAFNEVRRLGTFARYKMVDTYLMMSVFEWHVVDTMGCGIRPILIYENNVI